MATNWNGILSTTRNLSDVLAVLRKVLAELSVKADLTTIDEALTDIEGIKNDVTAELELLNKQINEAIQNGLMEPFATEAELLVSRPTVEKYAKAEDTKKIWWWGIDESEGETIPRWHDSGYSDLDLANDFTKENIFRVDARIDEIQINDFYIKPESLTNVWEGRDSSGNLLISVDKEGNFQQNYHFDFHTKPEPSSFLIVDNNLNLLFGNSDLFLRDFFTRKNDLPFITVDQNLNILNSNNEHNTDLDFSELSYSSINPIILKNKEPYLSYSDLCVQQDFTDELYTKDSFEIFKKHTDVYAFYDALQAQHSDRITGEVLGLDGLGNEIKQYTYTPLLFEDDGTNGWIREEMQPPKLVVTTGVHGNERDSILQLAILFYEILNRTNEIEQSAFLSQFQIVVVPVICPNGFDANTRENHNGVNINRNAPAGWSRWENGTAGQSAADQPETQIACNLPILHSDAVAFVDFHNYNYGILRGGWYGTTKEETLRVVKRIAIKSQTAINKDFTYLKDKPIRIAKNAGGTTCLDWQQTNGKNGYLIETPLFGGTQRPLFENRQYGLFIIRLALTEIMKHEIGA